MDREEPLEAYYRTYGSFIKRIFSQKVQRISIDAGFSCPNRDGKCGYTGCIYCNNESFRPSYSSNSLSLSAQIRKAADKLKPGTKYIVYFQSFSNTYSDTDTLNEKYTTVLKDENCVGLAIGTRPDCIDDEKLALISNLAKNTFITIEYGMQSPYSESLNWMKRGHDFDCFCKAVEKTCRRNIFICAHIILGIPGETREMMIETARKISLLPVDLLKIHQLQVIKGTMLEKLFKETRFPIWELDEYADFLCSFIEELREDIVIQRMYSQARNDLLVAPDWKKNKWEIDGIIKERLKNRKVVQGRKHLLNSGGLNDRNIK